ncbi:hypothetical protein AAFN88_16425 [Pelagibius sp. CAU 1746]|uniref:hypothetical protein n=1 Tax=Pelagibius sp. CAU 1746 TaxID=3140370 RepID=UPI00325C2C16
MPRSRSQLWQRPGMPLWSVALLFWLTVSPAQAEEPSWAFDVAHAHIAKNYAWPETDYILRIAGQDPDRVVVYVHHRDDEDLGRRNSQGSWIAGGGKSFEIVLSRKTHSVIWEWHFQ